MIALDLPGFGQSPMPRDEITIPGYARTVNALCEQLGLGVVELVGNSMGGFIAAEVAIQFPQRVDRLVLVSAAGISSANLRTPAGPDGRASRHGRDLAGRRPRTVRSRAGPGARHLALALVARYPSRLRRTSPTRAVFKGTGKPGFVDALRALPGVRLPRPPARDPAARR